MLISIIIPAYGHSEFIGQSIRSAAEQGISDCEIIIVNDGSPDDTAEKVLPFIEQLGVIYLEKQNGGQASARNVGLRRAAGKYIAFLDDDDVWPKGKLQWQIESLEQNPDAVIAWGYAESLYSGERLAISRSPVEFGAGTVLAGNQIHSPGQALIRADALHRINGLNETMWGTDDWDVYIRLAEIGRFIYEDRLSLRYRIHEKNASRNAEKMEENFRRVLDHHQERLERRFERDTPAVGTVARRIRALEYVHVAHRCFMQGRKHDAQSYWIKAFRNDITLSSKWKNLHGMLNAFRPEWMGIVWRKMKANRRRRCPFANR